MIFLGDDFCFLPNTGARRDLIRVHRADLLTGLGN